MTGNNWMAYFRQGMFSGGLGVFFMVVFQFLRFENLRNDDENKEVVDLQRICQVESRCPDSLWPLFDQLQLDEFEFGASVHSIVRCMRRVEDRVETYRTNLEEHKICNKKLPDSACLSFVVWSWERFEKQPGLRELKVFFLSALATKLRRMEDCHRELFCGELHVLQNWS